MKLDLHNYGLIGFQPTPWLFIQNYHSPPNIILEKIVYQCFKKEIDVCGITSKEFKIPKESIHDRFGYLVKKSKELPHSYKCDEIKDTALIIEKDSKKVILLNVQGVISYGSKGERIDFLVIGDNSIENESDLSKAINETKEGGLISMIHHPLLTNEMYCGMPEKELEKFNSYFDAIVTHDAQTPFPINLFTYFKREDAKIFASVNKIPQVAVSGSHRIEDIGTSYIEYNGILNLSNKDKLLDSLRVAIQNGKPIENDISLIAFLDWYLKFKKGCKVLELNK